jgi:hypothetical protein
MVNDLARLRVALKDVERVLETLAGRASDFGRSGGMVDAADSKSAVRKGVRVRVPPSVLNTCGVSPE